MSKKSPYLGMIVGVVLIVIPEPSTSVVGLAIVAYSAYRAGWLGKV